MQPPQNPYPQQPYPYPQQQQQQVQPYPQQQPMGYAQPGMAMQRPAAKRNVGLIVGGGLLFVIGALAFLVFAYNAWQYSTVEERFSDLKGAGWVVDLVKEADMRRMMIFGPIAAVFGLAGIILGFLGMRKK